MSGASSKASLLLSLGGGPGGPTLTIAAMGLRAAEQSPSLAANLAPTAKEG